MRGIPDEETALITATRHGGQSWPWKAAIEDMYLEAGEHIPYHIGVLDGHIVREEKSTPYN